MGFIIILMALVLERFFDWGHLRNWKWFDQYDRLLNASTARFAPSLRLAARIIPVVLVVGLVEYLLAGWLYGFVRFLFNLAILLYCFGPANLWVQLFDCLQAMQQGEAQVIETRVKTAFPYLSTANSQTLHQGFLKAIFMEGHQRIFAVLFWFALLGPIGAMLYRSLALSSKRATTDMAAVSLGALGLMEWLSSRLLGILFALGGHFVKVFSQWQKYAFQGFSINATLIAETGMAALDAPANQPLPENGEMEKAAIQLFDRALIIMLVISAVLIVVVS